MSDGAGRGGRAQVDFSQAVFQTLKRKYALGGVGGDDFDWNTMFKHQIDALHKQDRRNGCARFSTTHRVPIVTIAEYWLVRFRYFLYLHLGQFGALVGLHTLT